MPAKYNDIALTDAESAEIAAECIDALEWQLTYTANPNKDDIPTDEMIGAVSPKRPATVKLLDNMKTGAGVLKVIGVPEGARVILMPTTIRSIAEALADRGFWHQRRVIYAALDRANRTVNGH